MDQPPFCHLSADRELFSSAAHCGISRHMATNTVITSYTSYMLKHNLCNLHGCLLEADSDNISLCLEKCVPLLRSMKGKHHPLLINYATYHWCYSKTHALFNTQFLKRNIYYYSIRTGWCCVPACDSKLQNHSPWI